jgi:ATP-dependent Clp protease ATP-binding subunit ClpC
MEQSQNFDIVRDRASAFATKFGHKQIAPSHFLLAIIKTPECQAYQLMVASKVPVEKLGEIIVGKRFNQEEAGTPTGIPTAASKTCFTQASEIAMQSGGSQLRTEHLLIGLLADPTLSREVFGVAGINSSKLIRKILGRFGLQPEIAGENTSGPNRDFTEVCYNLTEMARAGKLDPVIGRKQEIERCSQILARRRKNNPVLVGDAGVGKTAIAEGLALSIVQKTAPQCLQDKQIYVFDVTGLISNTIFRGQLEGRVKSILDYVKKNLNVILFIDEIHLIVGAGNSIGGMDLSNMMKAALSRGEARVIGATTLDEYHKSIAKDSALERRFQPVQVEEPSDADTLAILHGSLSAYEKHHGVKYSPEAVLAALHLSKRYIPNRRLPDKAIDVLDEAGSAIKLAPSETLVALDSEIESVTQQKIAAANADRFTDAQTLWGTIRLLKVKREQLLALGETVRIVREEHIRKAISLISKVPVDKMNSNNRRDALKQAERLGATIIGQKQAMEAVSRYCRRGKTHFNDPKRPIGSFLLLGATGVGKTLLAKALALDINGTEESLIQLDMSEYMERHSAARLIGSPPGYIGYDDQNSLVERVRRQPYCVVLFDEIEKAHPDVWNMLLQILEEGKLTDGQGRIASFRNAIIILSSNVGCSILSKLRIGFNPNKENTREAVLAEAKKVFRPEFLNRIDEIIVFDSLTPEHCSQILDLELEKVRQRTTYGSITLSPALHDHVLKEGFSEEYGGRNLKKAVERIIADSISDALIREEIPEEGHLYLDWKKEKVTVSKMKEDVPIVSPILPFEAGEMCAT